MKSEALLKFAVPNQGEKEDTVESLQGSLTLQRSVRDLLSTLFTLVPYPCIVS